MTASWHSRIRQRRNAFLLAIFLTLFATGAVAIAGAGGGYLLEWWTVDTGGASLSTGGDYSLGGSVGQAEADPNTAAGGDYSLRGGFWISRADAPTADDPAGEPWWQDALRVFLPAVGN